MSPPPRRATDDVAMQLVRLRRSMESVRAQVLSHGGHGLEGSGLAVLMHLRTSGPLRTSSLADRLGLDPSTTSRHVAALERSGHVERVRDPDDGRAFLLQATAAGTRAFEDTRAVRDRLVACVLEDWTAQQVEDFAASLARFNDAVVGLDVARVAEHAPEHAPTREDHR